MIIGILRASDLGDCIGVRKRVAQVAGGGAGCTGVLHGDTFAILIVAVEDGGGGGCDATGCGDEWFEGGGDVP